MRKVKKEEAKEVTTVSDVDAHSHCKMRVSVKEDRVIEIQGDPTDPESKGELTVRGSLWLYRHNHPCMMRVLCNEPHLVLRYRLLCMHVRIPYKL